MPIKALTFDTGGTILDWHSGIRAALAAAGQAHGLSRPWGELTNEYRRTVMKGIVGQVQPAFNMDDLHRTVLDELLARHGLAAFTAADRVRIGAAWHELACWDGFKPALDALRERYLVASFTMLPLRLVMDVSRRNALQWDAIVSCEMLGTYKPNPQAYLGTAKLLGFEPQEILMVACHNFDLNAARSCGFRTAFVKRPEEWGSEPPPDPTPNPACDLVVADFAELVARVKALG